MTADCLGPHHLHQEAGSQTGWCCCRQPLGSCHTRPKSLSHRAHAGTTTWDYCCCSGCCAGVAAGVAAVCWCQRLLLGLPRGFHCVPGAYCSSPLSGSHPSHPGRWQGCCCCCCAAAGWTFVGWPSCPSCWFGQDTPGTWGNQATVWINNYLRVYDRR